MGTHPAEEGLCSIQSCCSYESQVRAHVLTCNKAIDSIWCISTTTAKDVIMKSLLLVSGVLVLSACTTTVPVAVIGQDGRILKGTSSASLLDGSFTVSDGKLTCSGSYDPLQDSATISMPVTCSDGRKGIVRAIRDTYTSGSGTVSLNDGYKAEFLFGKAAASF